MLHILPTCHSLTEGQRAPSGLLHWKALGAQREEIWVLLWALAHPLRDPGTSLLLSYPQSFHFEESREISNDQV